MRAVRNGRHVAISVVVGLFSGGAQRTALVIMAPFKRQPITGIGAVLPFCETKFLQRAVQKVASVVAGEGAARAICAPSAGREANDEQVGASVAKGGCSAVKPSRLSDLVGFAVSDEPGTERAVFRRFWRRSSQSSSLSSDRKIAGFA